MVNTVTYKNIEEYQSILLGSLKKPKSESEIHSDCYQYLKTIYPVVRCEVKLEIPRKKDYEGKTLRIKGKKIKRQKGARFDIVVCDELYNPKFIIEVKRKEHRINTKQKHYGMLTSLPCYTVGSLAQCKELISSVRGVSLAAVSLCFQ